MLFSHCALPLVSAVALAATSVCGMATAVKPTLTSRVNINPPLNSVQRLPLNDNGAVQSRDQTLTSRSNINPPLNSVQRLPLNVNRAVQSRDQASPTKDHGTNARRLAFGLPLKPPRRRHHIKAARAEPSGVPTTLTRGSLEVRSITGSVLGYVGNVPNDYGEYGMTTDAAPTRLLVDIDLTATGPTDIATVNGIAAYPFLGAIVGYYSKSANIGTGNSNYGYFGGLASYTTPGVAPAAAANSFSFVTETTPTAVASSIFSYDPATSAIQAQWINADLGKPNTILIWSAPDNTLSFTGDHTAFKADYGDSQIVRIKFIPV